MKPVRELEIKSKSGKTRALMNLRLTIPKNPSAAVKEEENNNNPFASAGSSEKISNPPTPTARNPFNRPKREDSFRSSTTSVDSQECGAGVSFVLGFFFFVFWMEVYVRWHSNWWSQWVSPSSESKPTRVVLLVFSNPLCHGTDTLVDFRQRVMSTHWCL